MNQRLEVLEKKVAELYAAKNPNRSDWADWLWPNHVLVVADYATELAGRFDADADLARVAALLHDVADASMQRSEPNHEETSLELGRQIMLEAGYIEADISVVIDDAGRFHGCRGAERPRSLEGKVLATADALAHFRTDFYLYAAGAQGNDWTLEALKQWALKKLERDFHNKILFEEVREETRPDYQMLKEPFSR